MSYAEGEDENQKPFESTSDEGKTEPMSTGDWEKELAGFKGDVGEGPEVPEKPLRLPTPPPGGFKVPSLEKLTAQAKKQPGDDKSEPGSGEDEEKELHEEEVKKTAPPKSRLAITGAMAGKSPTKLSRKEVETALRRATGSTELPKPGPKASKSRKRSGISVLVSVLLFFILALSVAAGYHFRPQRGVEYFMERLISEDEAVRSHARDQLSSLGPVSIPSLEKLIKVGDERETLSAVDTLALIESDESVRLLMALTTHENPNIRKRALMALGERAAPQAFSNIEEQLSSPDHGTRLCAIAALENFDPQKSVPILLDLLDDEDWQIRNATAKVLMRITGENLGIPKSTSTPDVNDMIRERWRKWWDENGPAFQTPQERGN